MQQHPARLNQRKRDGLELSTSEIRDIVRGVTDGTMGDAQLGAFLMAVCCRGMTPRETAAMTLAMRDSGTVLDLTRIPGKKVDKHSTGGVGDKVSLLLAPMVAAVGVPVPMISGRGLGHTGGTIDKLHSIPGYRTELTTDEFIAVLAECGFVMAGASRDIAPADARMYATRDVTGTVESIPLITASILSKKLAEGIDGLVLDVKCGRAAFMQTREAADALAESLVTTGREAGKDVVALVTDMDAPLGRAIGNALEVLEIVECLRGRGPVDLVELTLELGAEMLLLAGVADDRAAAIARLRTTLDDGSALARFRANVVRQGGDPKFVDDGAALGLAPVRQSHVLSDRGEECFVDDIDPLEVGLAAMDLGAGRRAATDTIDPLVGVLLHKQVGDAVLDGEALFTAHARDAASAAIAVERVAAAYRFVDHPVPRRAIVLGRR